MKIRLPIIIVLLMPLMIYAQEDYTTFIMEGKAPVYIDGRLDDWDSLAVKEGMVENYIAWDNTTPPQNKLDLSAVFRSFADEDALYFAVQVKDDHLVFNEGDYVRRWNDDSVEIFFDGDRVDLNKQQPDANDGQIRITFEAGETVLEGVSGLTGSMLHYTPPLMWEALGVRASLSTVPGGYTVEARIPSYLLNLESVSIGTEIGINIRVMDDDDGGRMDRFIDWANDQDNLSAELKTGNFGMLKITKRYPNTASKLSLEEVDDLHGRIYQTMKKGISEGQTSLDWSIFTPTQRKKKELLPLIAVIQRSQEQVEDAISNFTDLIAVASSDRVKNWAYDQIAGCYLDIGKYDEAEKIYETRLSQSEDSWLLMGIGDTYANQSYHEKALEYYQKVLDHYSESEYIDKVYYTMAGLRRALGDYAGARNFYNKLLTDHPDSHWAIYTKRRLNTLPVNEGSWATIEEVDRLIGQEKYKEAATIYKNLLNSTDEDDKRTVQNLGKLFYRREVFRDIIVHVVE
jgi:tetratricopeptide (TPR) repeat protein